ncbi:MAG TPA: 2-oxoglutarate dehydrogenase complex dihydrolipoyllysine-residue succinyltransferase [Ktedonobacteraceae bacterium]|jgi:2-oxoglutarate dehydrogenase E2 component (dihydrolipoamide succinyltransferase)|nr:2-oxoglutarate dehydrogenase complex dihydrolipoyllysine-residue succinyltransferase [Ktedonobacteraceae bacterium]
MSVEIHVPELGESIVDAVVANWLKHEGDTVNTGDALVELETDKINVEVSAEQSGVLQKIVKQEGEVVSVGDVLGVIGEGAGEAATPAQEASAQVELDGQRPVEEQAQVRAGQEAKGEQRPSSPLARRIAAEHHIDLAQVKGNSPHGRVTREDVISYLEQNKQDAPHQATAAATQAQPSAPPAPAAKPSPVVAPQPGREERIRLSRRRQTIAQRLVETQHTAAMLTTFNEIDMSAVMEVRSRRKESFKERYNVSLGFMSFFTKAVVGALKAFPRLNSEIQGNELVLKHYYDIGIAVGAEEGLVVPVLRDADRKSFAEIEREIADLAKKARENQLSLAELQGGTFTITNGGVFGSLMSTPILNGPQAGILGMHKIEQRPVVVAGQIVIRPMMYVALSYDHRIVDGREAVQFLVRVKELVEDPETLLLEG